MEDGDRGGYKGEDRKRHDGIRMRQCGIGDKNRVNPNNILMN